MNINKLLASFLAFALAANLLVDRDATHATSSDLKSSVPAFKKS